MNSFSKYRLLIRLFFSTLLLTLELTAGAQNSPSNDQQVSPANKDTSIQDQFPAKVNPAAPANPETMPMDTLKNQKKVTPAGTPEQSNPNLSKPKLTDSQMKAIIGNDKMRGTDSLGRKLYKASDGRTYYVNEEGAKVYIK